MWNLAVFFILAALDINCPDSKPLEQQAGSRQGFCVAQSYNADKPLPRCR